MAKQKLTEIELKLKNHTPPELNHAFHKTVSYSQFSIYTKCPHQWYLTYVENKQPYQATIHTVFGTAIHETIQEYVDNMYVLSGAAADRMNLHEIFQNKFSELYTEEYKKVGSHFSTPTEMGEFYEDAVNLLNYVKKNRKKIFTTKGVKLLDIELPLLIKVSNNIFLKGFIDVVFYDVDTNKVQIWDFKTSKSSWSDEQKKDEIKQYQLLLYKHYFSKQYDFPIENIEVKFVILKRKIWEKSEYPQPRVQNVIPPSGTNKMNKCLTVFNDFIKNSFDEFGKPQIKSYIKNVGESSCKWCPYRDDITLCDKKNVLS